MGPRVADPAPRRLRVKRGGRGAHLALTLGQAAPTMAGAWATPPSLLERAMRLIRLPPVLLLLLLVLRCAGGDAAALPPEAQKIVDKAEAAIGVVTKASDEQIAKIQAQELKDLGRLHDAAVKKGEQDKAAALQAKIEAVKSGAIPLTGAVLIAEGQKLAFLGDSITEQGWGKPTGYVKLVVSGLAACGITVTPVPAGISGHKSNDMLGRVDNDVLSKKPDWMTLSCGVNDVWHGANGVPLDKYQENITAILDKAKAAGVRVMILTSTVIGEDLPNANNAKLVAYNDWLRQTAKSRGLPLADLNADMQALIKEGGKAGTNLLTVDGVHMNEAGDRMMARGILGAFGLPKAMLDKADAVWKGGAAK
jgi:lysophospholipase L1-like esterase